MDGEILTTLYGGKVTVKFLGPTDDKPNRHMYYVDGVRKTGVTTFCGIKDKAGALVPWATELARDHLLSCLAKGEITEEDVYIACALHEEKKKKAAEIGDIAHKWVEAYINGEEPAMPDEKEAQIAVTAFLEWVEANKVKFLSSERVLYSKKHDYVGKMDIEAKVNGELCLIDIKTSNGLYNEYYMQTAAYVMADQEESKRKYDGRWLIRIAKESEKEYHKRMAKKNAARARLGKSQVEYPDYQVFEAKFLDNDTLKRDFDGFLAAKALFEFNKATDPWMNGK